MQKEKCPSRLSWLGYRRWYYGDEQNRHLLGTEIAWLREVFIFDLDNTLQASYSRAKLSLSHLSSRPTEIKSFC